MKNFRFILAVLTLCLMAASAFAQSNQGSLAGTVVDQQGAVVGGATVVVTDTGTGKERTLQTSGEGTFTVPQLEVGVYTVKITASGFKSYTATQLKIDVAQPYTLNVALEPGGVTENVTVVAGADIINSADAQLSTTVSQRQIVELPLNGRNPLSLILLQAGTSSNSAQNTTINGQRSSFTNITRDGINIQDNFIRANAVDFVPDRPNVDDTGEFTIITQNAGAEAGYGASQVQLVTPRGTSDFHGALYLYNRASHFASNTFFNNFSKVKRPFLNRNQYGGKLSGPFPLPRFGEGGASTWKNKGFFYGSYEGFRLRQSTSANRTILLPNARTGLLTYRDTSGVTRTVNILAGNFAALTGVNAIDPVIASRILANLPTSGNNASIGDQLNTTGVSFSRAQNQNRDAYTTRFDVEANEKHSFTLVAAYKKEFLLRPDVDAQQGGTACCFGATPFGFQDAHTPFLAGAWHWTPSSTLTNELRAGWQKSNPTFGQTQNSVPFYLQIPLINNPETGFDAQGRDTTIKNLQDNAVLVHGSHSLRFGGQYQGFKAAPFGPGAFGASYLPTYVLGGGTTPAFTVSTFNTAAGCVAATGVNCISSVTTANSLLALLGGLVGSANQTFTGVSKTGPLAAAPPLHELDYENYSFYGADQWRATPRLTLNFGLRYELFSPIREPNGLILEPVLGGRDVRTAILDPAGTYDFVGVNGNGNNFFKWDRNNFAPVFSFAWSPTFKSGVLNGLFPGEGRTVIRGGYRRSFVNDEFIRSADNALSGNAGLTIGLTQNGNFRTGTAPTFTAPALQVPRTYAQNNALAANFGTVFAIDPHLQVPSTDEINIGIEREIGWKTAVEARYVMGRSNNLVRGLDLNQVNIFNNGFYADFLRARNNIKLYGSGAVNCTVTVARPDCQPLQLLNQAPFNTSAFGNPLGFSNTINPIVAGDVGQLAAVYVSTFGVASSVLLNNRNTGVVDLITNQSRYRYNALQTEIRRRFSGGLTFQANYTFQKSLTDSPGTGQTRFEPLVDNAQPNLEYAIADTDTTHVFNLNMIYELPFGKGKRFAGGSNGVVDRILGGWQVTSIIRWDSGAPFSITDPRGTLNRAARSARQTAFTNLSKADVKKLVGTFRTSCGIFFINPEVINLDLTQCANGVIAPRVAGTTAGVASLGFDPITGPKTFPGQVFFNVAPGQTGNMERNFISGPTYFKWDASIIKNIRITETTRFQIRAEAFNVLNRSNFAITGQFTQANINSNTFGRLLTTFDPRIIQFAGRFEF
jgi:hypothetical protein